MSITRHVVVALASLGLAGALSTTPALAQSAHVLVPADEVQWGRCRLLCRLERRSPFSRAIRRRRGP